MDSHQGVEWRYTMKVTKVHDSALQRQVVEGFSIGNYKGDTLLNRKGEWGNNLPPRLIVEGASKERTATSSQRSSRSTKVQERIRYPQEGLNQPRSRRGQDWPPKMSRRGQFPPKLSQKMNHQHQESRSQRSPGIYSRKRAHLIAIQTLLGHCKEQK